jgi:formylglycine-generating enzyme required for sulfatase activity
VLRGGSWNFGPDWLRSATRYWSTPDDRDDAIGFRLAQD